MARAPKPRGISLEELMVAQQRMIEGGNLSERQSETAQRQIEKLTEIKTSLVSQEQEAVTLNNDVRRITRVKRDSRSVGLVDVRDEIRNLKDNLRGLPKLVGADKKSKEEKNKVTDEERTAILKKIGEVIGEKTALERGGARNETLTARNQATFEKFVQTTQEREKLLADADDKQREIFQELEDTLLKLREAGSEDSEKLRKELDKLSGELKATKKTAAQSNIGSRLENAQRMASGGDRGAQGTFGDALAALY
jgi:chromosome segregation ATPase